jgi:ferrochelatase
LIHENLQGWQVAADAERAFRADALRAEKYPG